jgi:hypothetical protein
VRDSIKKVNKRVVEEEDGLLGHGEGAPRPLPADWRVMLPRSYSPFAEQEGA